MTYQRIQESNTNITSHHNSFTRNFITLRVTRTIIMKFRMVSISRRRQRLHLITRQTTPFRFRMFVRVPPIQRPNRTVKIRRTLRRRINIRRLLLASARHTMHHVTLRRHRVKTQIMAGTHSRFSIIQRFCRMVINSNHRYHTFSRQIFLNQRSSSQSILNHQVVTMFARRQRTIRTKRRRVLGSRH